MVSSAAIAKEAIPKRPKSEGARTLARITVLISLRRRLRIRRTKTQSPPRTTCWDSVAPGLKRLPILAAVFFTIKRSFLEPTILFLQVEDNYEVTGSELALLLKTTDA
jgi:hypothetical protein